MFHQLDEVESIFQEIESALSSPEIVANQARFRRLSLEHRRLQPIVETHRRLKKLESEKEGGQDIIYGLYLCWKDVRRYVIRYM